MGTKLFNPAIVTADKPIWESGGQKNIIPTGVLGG